MSSINNSIKEYKSSENEQKQIHLATSSDNWSKEDMVASTQSNNNNTSNTEDTQIIIEPTLIYSPSLLSQDLEDSSPDDSIIAIAQNGDLFSLQELIDGEELQLCSKSDQILSSSQTTSPSVATFPSVPVKPIKPALSLDSSALSSTSNDESNSKKKAGGRKRKAESLEEKEQRQRERILRNRHAAQMSRDKKRRQMADLESQNLILKEDNEHLSKRLKVVEEENMNLSAKLDVISAQLAEIQSHLAVSTVSEMTKVLLDGVRGSAVSAALEYDSIALKDYDNNNGKEEHTNDTKMNGSQNEILPDSSSRCYLSDDAREFNFSKKSQQRHVKMRTLYGILSQIHSLPTLMLQQQLQIQITKLLLTFSIVFWTMTGQRKNFLLLGNQMVFVDDIVISELIRLLNEKRRLTSVKASRGSTLSGMKRAPRDWRKYPP
ncbi:15090_t:CDS:2 [Funneliformis caledonium]|uniref:15090_t:CDS:1 n=1 Tax=Funneliformis caledonium TaxID=1117310 RepID=A0A9N9EJ96_9GLOM|nr:15090_t:CDS:2 [Funneliformis caledonium]